MEIKNKYSLAQAVAALKEYREKQERRVANSNLPMAILKPTIEATNDIRVAENLLLSALEKLKSNWRDPIER